MKKIVETKQKKRAISKKKKTCFVQKKRENYKAWKIQENRFVIEHYEEIEFFSHFFV